MFARHVVKDSIKFIITALMAAVAVFKEEDLHHLLHYVHKFAGFGGFRKVFSFDSFFSSFKYFLLNC